MIHKEGVFVFDLVGFSEIDKSAVEVYCELHDVSKS